MTPQLPLLLSAAALLLLLPLSVRAQAVATSVAAADSKATITLSPFEVNEAQDQGYAASHSLAGGRMSTELIKTPADVTVLTKEFLNDLGALDYIDAAPYITSMGQTSPVGTTDHGHSQTIIRGMPAGVQTRNYFQVRRPTDAYITERLESMRGPNSLLFGDGALGGGLNTMTKRARTGRSFGEAVLRVDSEGSRYLALDFNRSLSARTAVRTNLFAQEARYWIDRKFDDRSGIHLAALHRPWDKAELRLEAEYGKSTTNYQPGFFRDVNSSYTTGYRVAGPLTVASPAPGVNRITTDTLIWSPTVSSRVLNLRNFGRTTGSNLALSPDVRGLVANFPVVPRNHSNQPSNGTGDIRHYLIGTYFEQQWGPNLAAEVAVQYVNIGRHAKNVKWDNYLIDPNGVLPDGSPNPKFGKAYDDKAWRWYHQDAQHFDVRAAVVYNVPVTRWNQRINLFVFRREEISDFETFQIGRNNNPANPLINATVNEPLFRIYWDDPAPRFVFPTDDSTYTWEALRTTDQRAVFEINSAQVASVAGFWDDRITVVAGVRADDFEQRVLNGETRDAAGRFLTRTWSGTAARPVTSSAGFVFFPIRQLGAYANYAETFNPVSAGTGSSGTGLQGQEYGPTRSHAYSGGLRFRLLRDRLVGSLGYYQMTEANRVAQYSAVGINRIWTNLNRGELQVNPAANSYRDTLDFFGSGVELDLTANFGRNFRLRGNVAKPKTRQTKTIPGLRAYYAQHIAAWRAGAADGNNPDQSQIATDIGSIETTLSNANENRVLNNTPDYTGSIFGMYTLTDAGLKGLRFGGGVAWQGPRVIGNEVGRSYDYVKSDGYFTANLSIGYPLRLRGRMIDLQFNVTNLLDHSDPIYNGTNPFQGRTVRTLYHYLDPRKAVLAITHRF